MEQTIKHKKWNNFQIMMEDSFNSNWYLFMELLIAIIGFAFNYELIAMSSLLMLMCFNMILCRDCTSSMFTFCLVTIVPLARYGLKFSDYQTMFWLFIPLAISFIVHIILYPKKDVKKGDMLFPIIAYSIAILLGGLGSISVENYFRLTTLYYTLVLGPIMIFFYIYFMAYIPDDTSKVIDYITRAMVMIGIMIVLMWASALYKDYKDGIKHNAFLPYRQWKNNIGNFTLLAFPFAFYASTYKKCGFLYFILGCIEYLCMGLSMCRGATVASTVLIPFIIIYTLVKSKGAFRKTTSIISLLAVISCCLFIFFDNKEEILNKLNQLAESGSPHRILLYKEAWANFIANPIFGAGIGYLNPDVYDLKPMSMFWYHSTIFQVIGSMGIVGLIAWGYLTIVRLIILFKKHPFNIFMLFSFLGFEAYSMINTGDFSPFPFATFLTFLLTIVSKHNAYLKNNKINNI